MPLEQRVISPICVSRGCVPMDSAGNLAINIPNELECVTNGTLANIIRQLSSLSRYAEDLFGGILADASLLVVRATTLQTRIERLGEKVLSLDSSVEEVSLQDIHLRKAFKSSTLFDQQVVARETVPEAIKDVYLCCDKPPPLQKLNPYREDGKDGLKFYTDPNYFFDLWRQEMLADTEKFLADKVKKVPKKTGSEGKNKRKVRQPANSRERYRQMMANQGEFIIDNKNHYMESNGDSGLRPNSLEVTPYQQFNGGQYRAPQQLAQHLPPHTVPPQSYYLEHKYQQEVNQMNRYNEQHFNAEQNPQSGPQSQPSMTTPTRRQTSITSRPSQPPPAPPSAPSSGPSTPSHTAESNHSRARTRETLPPPPPPPPPPQEDTKMSPIVHIPEEVKMEPPPPPPPPPSESLRESGQQFGKQFMKDLQSIQLKKTVQKQPDAQSDARSDLLQAIREGIQLKRVEDCKQREVEKSTPLHDVASILARRVAIELSDSEGGADDDCEDESDGWDDESEC